MESNKILITAFSILVLLQLAVPAKMIWDRENILSQGKMFKFETAPVDPTDPFRGKYITLSFKENSVHLNSAEEWYYGDKIYVLLKTDDKGFASVQNIARKKPDKNDDYVEAKVQQIIGNTVEFSYPFDRFYMEESKAPEAEKRFLQSHRDSTSSTFAVVKIKGGKAVLKDVFVDGQSLSELKKDGNN